MTDVVRANVLFGGTRSALQALRCVIPHLSRQATLLDVGTGLGDVPAAAEREAARASVELTTIGVDVSHSLLHKARVHLDGVAAGNALRLPVSDNCADVVMCSQLLHHFDDRDALQLIAELHRASRGWVIVSDLQRSWFAAGGFFLASTLLRFHPVTRHDGVMSVLRGFTVSELEALVRRSTSAMPEIRTNFFWRVSAWWCKHSPSASPRQ